MKNSEYLLNRVFLLALFMLLFNDFYLKAAAPSLISGKLSDFSGLIVFVLFFIFLFGKRFKGLVFIATALLFYWWKSSFSEGFIQGWNLFFPFYAIERVVDYTDLFCLLILVPFYFYQPKQLSLPNNKWLAMPVLLLTVFAISATSKAKGGHTRYDRSQKYLIDQSFKIKKVTHAELLQHLSLSNLKIEKNTGAPAPEKPSDPHYYTLQNFEISDGVIVESMHISVKEKKGNLKLLIQDVTLYDPPEKADKEVKKMLVELFEAFFSIGK